MTLEAFELAARGSSVRRTKPRLRDVLARELIVLRGLAGQERGRVIAPRKPAAARRVPAPARAGFLPGHEAWRFLD